MPEVKPFDEGLRAKLQEYRTSNREQPLTMNEIGQELGVSGTRVNKYLRGSPEGDVAELEAKIADLLKAVAKRRDSAVKYFPTNVSAIIMATLELIRKTNDVGLISGPAGIGKSVTISEYQAAHPLAMAISATRWQRDDRGISGLLFAQCETGSWNGYQPRAEFICSRLRGSNRPVIIDNAHRMTESARQWVFDMHDETGCPIALIGNPEILVEIKRNDQQFSRIGIHQQVTLDQGKIAAYARAMVDALVPQPQAALYDLACEVAEQRGHLRALRKQLMLMLDLAGTQHYAGDQARAFNGAHARLVREYKL